MSKFKLNIVDTPLSIDHYTIVDSLREELIELLNCSRRAVYNDYIYIDPDGQIVDSEREGIICTADSEKVKALIVLIKTYDKYINELKNV